MFMHKPPEAVEDIAEGTHSCWGCGEGEYFWWRVPGRSDPWYVEDFCTPACAVVAHLRGTFSDGNPISASCYRE